jgi:hypothetical protein
LNATITKLEERRQVLYGDFKKGMTRGIIVIVFAAVLFLAAILLGSEDGPSGIMIVIAGMVAVVGFIQIASASRHAGTFKTLIKTEFITEMLKEQFENVEYRHKDMISVTRINATEMIKRPDRFSGEDLMIGEYKGVRFEVSDIDLKERVETTDSQGRRHVSYQTYFKGRWYIYTFGRMFEGTLKIAEGRGWSVGKRGLEKMESESMAFNKKFAIYTSSQEYAFYHLTPRIMEKFMELEKLHKGQIVFCFKNNELHIGVNDHRDYMEMSIRKPLDGEAVKVFQSDIDVIPAIINEMKLDSTKFKS